jgi:hypothetical protein
MNGVWFPVQNDLSIFHRWIVCILNQILLIYNSAFLIFIYLQTYFWWWVCRAAVGMFPWTEGGIQLLAGVASQKVVYLLRTPWPAKPTNKMIYLKGKNHFLLKLPCTFAADSGLNCLAIEQHTLNVQIIVWQHLLLLNDTWWVTLLIYLNVVHFIQH